MEYTPAAILWLLTIVRIPTVLNRERVPVLHATFLAAVALTLFTPAVYAAVDPILGGNNRVGLLLVLAIMAASWQFHTATILATSNDAARRRRHLMRGRLAAALAGICVVTGFFVSHVEVTNQYLPLAYADQTGMQLFMWAASAFIIWVCTDIVLSCMRYLPKMCGRSFKSGVVCFAVGCIFTALALGSCLAIGLLKESPLAKSGLMRTLELSFPALVSLAVLAISIGLILPRFREANQAIRRDIRSRRFMLLLTPVWRRSSQERRYLLRNRWTPLLDPIASNSAAHLHRRVIEIRDCQQRGMTLLPRDRILINQAEELLQGH